MLVAGGLLFYWGMARLRGVGLHAACPFFNWLMGSYICCCLLVLGCVVSFRLVGRVTWSQSGLFCRTLYYLQG
jgi:hypothetical protein